MQGAASTILTARATAHINAARAAMTGQVGTGPSHGTGRQAAHAVGVAINHAFVAAFDDTFGYMVVAAVVGAAMGLALLRVRSAQTSAAPARPRRAPRPRRSRPACARRATRSAASTRCGRLPVRGANAF